MQRRARNQAPILKRHSRGGSYAYVEGRQKWFGPYDDPETHKKFGHYLALWEANGGVAPPEPIESQGKTCETLVAALPGSLRGSLPKT